MKKSIKSSKSLPVELLDKKTSVSVSTLISPIAKRKDSISSEEAENVSSPSTRTTSLSSLGSSISSDEIDEEDEEDEVVCSSSSTAAETTAVRKKPFSLSLSSSGSSSSSLSSSSFDLSPVRAHIAEAANRGSAHLHYVKKRRFSRKEALAKLNAAAEKLQELKSENF
jgi:hypothetical protein